MSRDKLKVKLRRLVEPLIEEHGLELVQLDYHAGRKGHLCLYIDKPGGVTISDCEALSRDHRPSGRLRSDSQSYILEVSSPGVERPLTEKAIFSVFRVKW